VHEIVEINKNPDPQALIQQEEEKVEKITTRRIQAHHQEADLTIKIPNPPKRVLIDQDLDRRTKRLNRPQT